MNWEDVRDYINENFQGKSPQNVIDYVDTNVTDLASIKVFLRMLALTVLFVLYNKNWNLGDTGIEDVEEE